MRTGQGHISTRENRRGKYKLTIQKHGQQWAQDTDRWQAKQWAQYTDDKQSNEHKTQTDDKQNNEHKTQTDDKQTNEHTTQHRQQTRLATRTH